MGALTIAFDTTVVGALALPWVVLVIHLFFFEGENRLGDVLDWVKRQQMQAVAGVLLFAAAYTLGSAVSRITQDFFNDDDLFLQPGGGRLLRMGVTEDRILTSVYCKRDDKVLLRAGKENPALEKEIANFQGQKGNCPSEEEDTQPSAAEASLEAQKPYCLCRQTLSWYVGPDINWEDDKLNEAAANILGLEESALLLKGEDATLRLRQLHDQLMVLRGAAFNGLVTTSFCLFAWGARLRREKARWALRALPTLVPAVFLYLAVRAAMHHFHERFLSDPPYMEFSLFLIGAAGAWLLWIPRGQAVAGQRGGPHWRWVPLAVVCFVLSLATWEDGGPLKWPTRPNSFIPTIRSWEMRRNPEGAIPLSASLRAEVAHLVQIGHG